MHKSRVRLMLVALLGVFAFGAVAAAAAQAEKEEAPFWSIKGTRLGENETHYITAKSAKVEGTFVLEAGATKVTCPTVKLKEGVLLGSKVGNEGKNDEIIEFEKSATEPCKVAGNGAGCTGVEEPIKTTVVKSELAYAVGTKTILTVFKPETGVLFTTIKFTGTCTINPTKVEGESVGEAKSDPEETGKSYLLKSLGALQPTKVLLVKNGETEEVAVKRLAAFGKEATLTGTALILLAKKNSSGGFESELVEWSPLS